MSRRHSSKAFVPGEFGKESHRHAQMDSVAKIPIPKRRKSENVVSCKITVLVGTEDWRRVTETVHFTTRSTVREHV